MSTLVRERALQSFLCVITVLLTLYTFCLRDAMLALGIAFVTSLSVHPSVCHEPVLCPSGCPIILVFWCQISSRHSKGSPSGGLKQGWGGKIRGNVTLAIPLLRKNIAGHVHIVPKTCIPNLKVSFYPPKLGVTWPWPRPLFEKNMGVMSILSIRRYLWNLKSSFNHFEAIVCFRLTDNALYTWPRFRQELTYFTKWVELPISSFYLVYLVWASIVFSSHLVGKGVAHCLRRFTGMTGALLDDWSFAFQSLIVSQKWPLSQFVAAVLKGRKSVYRKRRKASRLAELDLAHCH